MLTWDDETTAVLDAPTTAAPVAKAAPAIDLVQACVAAATKLAGVINAVSAVTGKTFKRIKAAEKRMINGQSDLTQLTPIKYK